jgi:hypothetical protein
MKSASMQFNYLLGQGHSKHALEPRNEKSPPRFRSRLSFRHKLVWD